MSHKRQSTASSKRGTSSNTTDTTATRVSMRRLLVLASIGIVVLVLLWQSIAATSTSSSPSKIIDHANTLVHSGNAAAAKELLTHALFKHSNNADLLLALAAVEWHFHRPSLQQAHLTHAQQMQSLANIRSILANAHKAIRLSKQALSKRQSATSSSNQQHQQQQQQQEQQHQVLVSSAHDIMAKTLQAMVPVTLPSKDEQELVKQLLNNATLARQYPGLYCLQANQWFEGSTTLDKALLAVSTAIELGYIPAISIKAEILWDVASHMPDMRSEMEAQRKQILQYGIHQFVEHAAPIKPEFESEIQSWFTRLFHLNRYAGKLDEALVTVNQCIERLPAPSLCYQNRYCSKHLLMY
jgi:hypothetical protein